MDLNLKDKIVLVTGGASGIGAAIVMQLAREGAVPVILDRDALSRPMAEELKALSPKHYLYRLDLCDERACSGTVADILQRFHGIDALVNNAGINDHVGLEADVGDFRRSLEANLVHCFLLAHLCAEAIKHRRGAIVNVSSKTAVTGQGRTSGYVAAKAALLGLTREWAASLAPHGVRVNAVLPAEVLTPMYERWAESQADPAATLKRISDRIPLGHRMTTPEEIANVVVFLVSERSSHTTGQWLHPDGGYVHLDRILG
jgi:L-fucose dehydrogenase